MIIPRNARPEGPARWARETGIEIALAASAALAAGSSIAGGMQQAKAANAAAQFSAFQARQAEVQGIIEGNEIIRSANRTQASNIARFGAAGIALGEGGVPEQVNEAVRRDAAYNLNISRLNSKNTATALRLQGSEQSRAARAARIAGAARGLGQLTSAGIRAYG